MIDNLGVFMLGAEHDDFRILNWRLHCAQKANKTDHVDWQPLWLNLHQWLLVVRSERIPNEDIDTYYLQVL